MIIYDKIRIVKDRNCFMIMDGTPRFQKLEGQAMRHRHAQAGVIRSMRRVCLTRSFYMTYMCCVSSHNGNSRLPIGDEVGSRKGHEYTRRNGFRVRENALEIRCRSLKSNEPLEQAPDVQTSSESGKDQMVDVTGEGVDPPHLPTGLQQRIGPNAPKRKLSSQMKRFLQPFANLKLAIGELAAVALLSSIGTVIEQNKSAAYYATYYPNEGPKVLGFVTSNLILGLQLDHIYSSDYFLALLGLLAVSLAACTATTQWPMVQVAQRWRFRRTEKSFQGLPFARVVPQAQLRDLGEKLVSKGYQIFVRGDVLYAFKGLGGKFAPIGVHASMLITLAGIVMGILGGFRGTAFIPEGGETTFGSILEPATMLALPPKGSSAFIKVDDFRISYRPDGSVQQFFTDLLVENENGQVLDRQTISVNKPLRFGGITAYQTDWSMASLSIRLGADQTNDEQPGTLSLPMASLEGKNGVSGKLYAAFLPIEVGEEGRNPKGISFLARDLESVVIYNSKGEFVGVRRPSSKKPIEVEGIQVVVDGITCSSGMEFKADPGVPFVYAGFGGICITTVLSYLSHSQVWGLQSASSVLVGGKSNRATIGFEMEMDKLIETLPEVDL